MEGYQQLSGEERTRIDVLLKEGVGIRGIGRRLKRAASTISREVSRNGNVDGTYYAVSAQGRANLSQRGRPAKVLLAYTRMVLGVRKVRPRLDAPTNCWALPPGASRIDVVPRNNLPFHLRQPEPLAEIVAEPAQATCPAAPEFGTASRDACATR